MFVLRAKCALSDARGEVQLVGLVGAPATGWLADAAPDATWERRERDGLSAIRLPDAAGCVRYLCALDTGASIPWPPPAADAWRWLEVRSGVARIEQSTVERFVPQMLNYELLGGVDFHKGCYPGQEVVARSQYRGAVKRRSFLFEAPCAALAGDEVFHSDDAAQPAGTVVNAAAQPTGYPAGSVALVEVKLAVLAGGSLHLGAAQGPQLRQIALPYEVALGTLGAD
jgi:folate-binding protein YgfZ